MVSLIAPLLRSEEWLESDADEQLILRIPFTGSVKRMSRY